MKRNLNFMKPHQIFKMAAPIPLMLKYSIVYNLLDFPPILIKFVSKLIVCKVLYFKAQSLLRLRSPLRGLDRFDVFSPIFTRNTSFLTWLPVYFPAHQSAFENGANLQGRNLRRIVSFWSRPIQRGGKTFLTDCHSCHWIHSVWTIW